MASVSGAPTRRFLSSREILEARRRQAEICRRKQQLLNDIVSKFKKNCLSKKPGIGVRAAMRQSMNIATIQPAQGLLQKHPEQLSNASGLATPVAASQKLTPSFRSYSPLDISGFLGDVREAYNSVTSSSSTPERSPWALLPSKTCITSPLSTPSGRGSAQTGFTLDPTGTPRQQRSPYQQTPSAA